MGDENLAVWDQHDLSPTGIRFASALRGIAPAKAGTPFSYGVFIPQADAAEKESVEVFLALAASNPEGRFFGFMPSDTAADAARILAQGRQVSNVLFVAGTPQTLADSPAAVPKLDFLVVDTTKMDAPLNDAERADLYDALNRLARIKLRANGFFVWTYACENPQALAWLRAKLLVESNESNRVCQTAEGILTLADRVLATLPDERAAWERLQKNGEEANNQARPNTNPDPTSLRVAALFEHDDALSFIGDAALSANYLELVAPLGTHDFLIDARDNTLYELFKDLAIGRARRTDIWCRTPITRTQALSELFAGFTFGLTVPRSQIKNQIKTETTTIDIEQGVYHALVELLDTLPVTIGDCVSHPSLTDKPFQEVFDALMVLAAVGVARPMRATYLGHKTADFLNPTWASPYNKTLNADSLKTTCINLASPTTGSPVSIPLREALVLQAVTRVGLQNSPKALLGELCRINGNPTLAAFVSDITEHTEDSASQMVSDTVARNMARWYAWGLLAA